MTGVLVRRGADFATAEDAVQEALVRALTSWPADPPADPKGWLITVAWRKFLDAARADQSRHAREGTAARWTLPTRRSAWLGRCGQCPTTRRCAACWR